MADNVAITAGSGTSISTAEVTTLNGGAVAAVEMQRVKVTYGTGATAREVDTGFPLPVMNPDVIGSGTITTTDAVVPAPGGAGATVSGASTAGSYVALACPGGDSAWNIQITGLTSGTLYFEESLDSTTGVDGNWIAVNGRQTGVVNTILGNNSTTNGVFRGNTSGSKYIRVRSVGALTGTPAILIRLAGGVGAVFLNASLPGGTNNIGVVTAPALTKGTQPSTGFATQDLKDSGRVSFAAATVIAGVTAVTTEALLSLVPVRAGVAGAAVTTLPVTAGKRLRLTAIDVGFISTSAAVLSGRFVIRTNPSGAVTATSPILMILPLSSGAALAQAGNQLSLALPDGMEFAGTDQFGISFVGSAITGTVWASLKGFEY